MTFDKANKHYTAKVNTHSVFNDSTGLVLAVA